MSAEESNDTPYEGDEPGVEGLDPSMVAFLDQETEEFNDAVQEFEETFGFTHFCTCAQDYTDGNVAETTKCFGRLCQEAMDACKKLKRERDLLLDVIQQVSRRVEHNDPEGTLEREEGDRS